MLRLVANKLTIAVIVFLTITSVVKETFAKEEGKPNSKEAKDSTATPPVQPPPSPKSPDGKKDAGIFPRLPPVDKQRFFIQSIDVGPSLNTLDRDLLQRVVSELPTSILTARKLEYYDPSAIVDTAKFKLDEQSTTLEPDSILKTLLAENLRWMLLLSISLAPGGRDEKRMLLTGRLIDLVEQNCKITRANIRRSLREPGLSAESAAELRKQLDTVGCTDKMNAVYTAAVDLKDFDDLKPSVRSLFAMLFEIPEIEATSLSDRDFSTEKDGVVRYNAKSNLRTKDAKLWNNPYGFEGYTVETKLFHLDPALIAEVCSDPRKSLRNAREWDDVTELGHEVTDLRFRPVANLRTFPNGEGVARVPIEQRFEGTYLLAATLMAVQQQDSYRAMTMPADPSVMCIRIHEPRLRYGVGVRWNTLYTSQDFLNFGLDLALSYKSPSARRALFSSFSFGPLLGLGYQALLADSSLSDSVFRNRITMDLRLRFTVDVARIPSMPWSLVLVAFADGGGGFEWRGATLSDLSSGWWTYAAYGGGFGVRIANRIMLSAWYQQLYRWRALTDLQPADLQLPPTSDSWWLQLTFEGARPNANLRRRMHPGEARP